MNGRKAKALRREARRQQVEAIEHQRMFGGQDPLTVVPERVIYKAVKRAIKRRAHA